MGKKTILIVDDEKNIVNLLKEYFEAQGFVIITGQDGQMAIALSRVHHPNLIIMDVDMPHLNGLQALKALREDPETHTIPVIMLTGVASSEIYPKIAALSRVSHVKKPVSLEDVDSLVKHYLPDAG